MSFCRNCATELTTVFCDLGMSPPPNDYRRTLEEGQKVYSLKAYVCNSCKLVQLPETVKCEEIFSDYPYFSSMAPTWVESRRVLAHRMIDELKLGPETLVIDVASNDGYYLKHFVERGIPVLGVEPAGNIAPHARELGVPTDVAFFGRRYALDKVSYIGGGAALINAANVLAHVPDIHDFIEGFPALLATDGVATFEFPAVTSLLKYSQLDTIYHEHYSYLSALVVYDMLLQHGMYIWRIEKAPSHGGSYRVFASKKDARWSVEQSVADILADEYEFGLHELGTYTCFQDQCYRIRSEAMSFLLDAHQRGAKVVGYGAPAKTTTLANYIGINQELLQYTVDDSPFKQDRYVPGTNIPIVSFDHLLHDVDPPKYIIIFPWNLKEALRDKLAESGLKGTVVTFIPKLMIG